MKRDIFNPFETSTSISQTVVEKEDKGNIEAQAFSVEDPNSCPKCSSQLVDAAIGGHGDVAQSQVKYCTKCRVVIPVQI